MFRPEYQRHLTTRAAQWGADRELEECCWVVDCAKNIPLESGKWLYNARRPGPPSLKERALEIINLGQDGWGLANSDWNALRCAIQLLPEDYET